MAPIYILLNAGLLNPHTQAVSHPPFSGHKSWASTETAVAAFVMLIQQLTDHHAGVCVKERETREICSSVTKQSSTNVLCSHFRFFCFRYCLQLQYSIHEFFHEWVGCIFFLNVTAAIQRSIKHQYPAVKHNSVTSPSYSD